MSNDNEPGPLGIIEHPDGSYTHPVGGYHAPPTPFPESRTADTPTQEYYELPRAADTRGSHSPTYSAPADDSSPLGAVAGFMVMVLVIIGFLFFHGTEILPGITIPNFPVGPLTQVGGIEGGGPIADTSNETQSGAVVPENDTQLGAAQSEAEPQATVTVALLPDVLAVGGLAFTVGLDGENLRVRREPSTTSDIVYRLPEGTLLHIKGGPVDADGYTWWNVTDFDDSAGEGWVAGQFLEPAR